MIGTLYYWGVNLNGILNIFIAINFSISIDFSSHIAQTYLNVTAPKSLKTPQEVRIFKSGRSISMIGSSVFHCGMSTFCSILVLAPAKSFVFKVFFKSWFCTIFFGMINGFLLMPVMLSFMGSTEIYLNTESYRIEEV